MPWSAWSAGKTSLSCFVHTVRVTMMLTNLTRRDVTATLSTSEQGLGGRVAPERTRRRVSFVLLPTESVLNNNAAQATSARRNVCAMAFSQPFRWKRVLVCPKKVAVNVTGNQFGLILCETSPDWRVFGDWMPESSNRIAGILGYVLFQSQR